MCKTNHTYNYVIRQFYISCLDVDRNIGTSATTPISLSQQAVPKLDGPPTPGMYVIVIAPLGEPINQYIPPRGAVSVL